MRSFHLVLMAVLGLLASAPRLAAEKPPRSPVQQVRVSPSDDDLPPGALMRLGTTRFRANLLCSVVAYSPDGKLLASAGYGGVVLWDAQSGKRQAFLKSGLTSTAVHFGKEIRRNIYRLAFSRDSRYLAAGCEGEAIVWELATKVAIHLRGDERESATDLVGFTADNRGVFTGDASEVQLRDRKTGKLLKRWETSARRFPKEKKLVKNKQPRFGTKALSSDGKSVAAYVVDGDGKFSLKVWEVDNGESHRIEGVDGLLALSPNHTTLAALGRKLTLFDVATGKVTRSWPIQKREGVTEVNPLGANAPWPLRIAFSADGKNVAIPGVVWSIATGKELCKLDDEGGSALGLCFSPDGKTLATSKGEWIDFWTLPAGKKIRDFPNHRGHVVDLAYSPDGRQLATVGTDYTVRLWDTRTGKLIRSFEINEYSINSLAFSPDGQRLATAGSDCSVAIWNTSNGRKLQEIRAVCLNFTIRSIAFSADSKILLVAGSADGSRGSGKYIREWNLVSGEERRHFGEVKAEILSIALSPDSKTVTVASDDRIVRLWDRTTGKLVHQLREPHEPGHTDVSSNLLTFSPDGGLLAAVGYDDGGTIRIGDVALGKYRGKIVPYPNETLSPSRDRIYSLAFSPDGKTLISSGGRGEIRLLEVFSGRERGRFNTQASKVVFAPDGKTAASGAHGGALIWDIPGCRRSEVVLRDPLSEKELEHLWTELASPNGAVAHRAIWRLIASKKQAVPFLRCRVRVVPPASAEKLKELIDGLDSDNFEERERSSRELAIQGEVAKPALLVAVAQNRSLELRRRAENLLTAISALSGFFLPQERLRVVRVIEVFEQAGGSEAREALEVLAGGTADMVEAAQARAALQRLGRPDR